MGWVLKDDGALKGDVGKDGVGKGEVGKGCVGKDDVGKGEEEGDGGQGIKRVPSKDEGKESEESELKGTGGMANGDGRLTSKDEE